MTNRGSAKQARSKAFQTEALQITHLDLFHNAWLTEKKQKKKTRIAHGINFKGPLADHRLIRVTIDDFKRKCN